MAYNENSLLTLLESYNIFGMLRCILSLTFFPVLLKAFHLCMTLMIWYFKPSATSAPYHSYLHCRKWYFALKDLGTFWKVVVRRRKGKETNIKMSSVETALEGVFRAGMYSRYGLTNKKFCMCGVQKREINYEMKPMLCEKVCFRNFPGVSNG